MVYIKDAVRTLDGTEHDKAILTEIETSCCIAVKMKQANRFSKLLGTVLLRPVWRNNRMDMDILTPDVLDVKTGDTPEDLKSVQITHYDTSGRIDAVSYSLWTPDFVRTVDALGHVTSEVENPYEILPFVPCWNHPVTDSFWQRGASDLLLIQDAINRILTLLAYTIDFQGFSTCYIKGVDNMDARVNAGPGAFVGLPASGDIGFVSPDAPIEEIIKVVDYLAKQAAITNGLPASVMSTEPTEQSGVSRIVGNQELEEMRADDVALFTEYERKLFDVFRVVWNTHNPARKISTDAVFQIDFHDPKPSMTVTEQVQNWEKLLGMGLISPVDILMERNPDLSRDEAKARLLQMRDEIQDFATAFPA